MESGLYRSILSMWELPLISIWMILAVLSLRNHIDYSKQS
ncbi:hypothetical protein LEP1GSC097_2097 [Leptospira interrogans serovar Grippotyphosa str. UI 08368]|nr:hypothetical protein LEP1GSC097_2097 [Leptospira interrogans serovar Grippotyphosa str. UI 08368]